MAIRPLAFALSPMPPGLFKAPEQGAQPQGRPMDGNLADTPHILYDAQLSRSMP
jgi:hypothetical protein